jgi:thiamine monophosphate synthase
MTHKTPPDLETVNQWAAKVQEICKRADAEILILDDIIARIKQDIHSSKLYQFRLRRAHKLAKSTTLS